jgi:hypothetical protein
MRQDIILDDNNDLLIVEGDFVVDVSDEQHFMHIISSSPNNWKNSPLTGAAIIRHDKAPMDDVGKVSRKIKLQLEADGYQKADAAYKDGQFILKGEAND